MSSIININEYTWTPERIAALEQFHAAAMAYAVAVNEEHPDGADVYQLLKAKSALRNAHGITDREYRAFKSRKAVKCSTVAQAINALTGLFAKKSERAA